MEERFTYFAFISYSHLDEKWAIWIQKKLMNYRLPNVVRKEAGAGLPKRIHPVFRDATDLGVGRLRESLRQELTESRFLIVVCSPRSSRPNVKGEHWVNDEVKSFIELGRVDRIIPVIVEGEPDSADPEKECFPPAIREAQIKGVDATKLERGRVLNDIAARILGLRPDVLWQRAEREAVRKWRIKVVSGLVAAAVAALGGCFYWEYTREKTACYADYVEEFGLPHGLFPLTSDCVAKRQDHYRFVTCRRRLVSVVFANSAGIPVPQHHTEYKNRPIIQKFKLDSADGHVLWVDHCDRMGRILQRLVYSGSGSKVVADFESVQSESGIAVDRFMSATTTAVGSGLFDAEKNGTAKSEIKRLEFIRDAKGRVVQMLYRKGKNSYPARDADGIFGISYVLDDLGRVVEMWYLNEKGGRHPNRLGVAGRRYQYTGTNLSKAEYVDQNSRPVVNDDGWMVCLAGFDHHGNIAEESYSDSKGVLSLHKDGFARVKAEYDERGNAIKAAYYGLDGQLILRKDGYARWKKKYDVHGNEIEASVFDIEGNLTLLKGEGFAKRVLCVDSNGNITNVCYYGVDGQPTLHKDGNARVTQKYDARGNVTEYAYYGVDGKPTLHKDGYARVAAKYDERGNMTEWAYYGVDGKPTLHKDGNARVTLKYDERGNVTEWAYYGVDGKPTLHKDGYARMTQKYDEGGNATEWAYYGVDDKPTLNKDGYARMTQKYDERGNATEWAYYGVDDKPTLHKDGYARLTKQYDERGNVTEWAYYGVDGSPCLDQSDSTWKAIATYDERGNATEWAYFGVDGKPTLHKDGYARMTQQYDARGNATELAYYGVDDKPTLHKDGYARQTASYDERGNVTNVMCYGVDGKSTLSKEGYARLTKQYDERGNATNVMYYGVDGQPTLNKDGYARWTQKYDARGNVTEWAYYGVNGKLILHKDGYARVTKKYDERGNVTEEAHYGVDGHRTSNKDGYYLKKLIYNEQGKVVEEQYFDTKDQACLYQKSYHRAKAVYDARGNIVEVCAYDGLGHLVPGASGFPVVRQIRDARGNVTDEAYYGVDDKPTLHKDGYARLTKKYDERGNATNVMCYGMDDKPTLHKEGYARLTKRYDARGNVKEWACYGLDDKPTLHKEGYARLTQKYDERGNVTEYAYYGVDNKPTLHKDGYARQTASYDERGNVVELSYWGTNDKPCPDANGDLMIKTEWGPKGKMSRRDWFSQGKDGTPYINQSCTCDDDGNVIEIAYCGADGKPRPDKNGNVKVETAWANGKRVEMKWLRLGANKLPYVAQVKRFDHEGNEVEEAYYGVDGLPGANSEDVARVTTTWGPRGKVASKKWFHIGENGALYLFQSRLFDDDGRQIEESYFDKNNKPRSDANGDVMIKTEWGPRGKTSRRDWFSHGKDGTPYINQSSKYDDDGNVIEEAYFGADGQPRSDKNGNVKVETVWGNGRRVEMKCLRLGANKLPYVAQVKRFDHEGNEVEEAYYGVDGLPGTNSEDVARVTTTWGPRGKVASKKWFRIGENGFLYLFQSRLFDDDGRQIEESYFDKNNKPRPDENGDVMIKTEWGPKGKTSRRDWFSLGKEGRPYINQTKVYNDNGAETEESYLDESGNPRPDKKGLVRLVIEWQKNGKMAKLAGYGLRKNGTAYRWQLITFDENGDVLKKVVYDEDGNLLPN